MSESVLIVSLMNCVLVLKTKLKSFKTIEPESQPHALSSKIKLQQLVYY